MKVKIKSDLPAATCFQLGSKLIVAIREAGAVLAQAEKTKQVRRFGYLMNDVKIALLHASYAKDGVSQTARKLAEETAAVEFAYLKDKRPKEKRVAHFKKEMESLLMDISNLADKVSRRCGMDPDVRYDQTSRDLRKLELKAQKKK